MRASVYIEPQKLELQNVPRPSLQPGDILLKVRACGVCGSDIRKIQYNFIRPPAIFGHEVAGIIDEIGPGENRFSVGDPVVLAHHVPCFVCHYCLHGSHSMCPRFKTSNIDPGGFSEYVRVPAAHVTYTTHRIPEGMSFDTAIHMEPLACMVRNLNRVKIQPGDTVLVIGLGSVGLLTGQLAKARGARVLATDLHEARRTIFQELGFSTLDGRSKGIREWVLKQTDQRGADLVVLTAGNPAVYGESIRWVRDGGTISVFAGLGPNETLSIDANEFYHREITLYSSYSSSPADLVEALQYLQAGTVRVDVLRAQTYPLEDLATAIEGVMSQQTLKAVIHP